AVGPAPAASDRCDAQPVVTLAEVTTAGACAGSYSVTRTWAATDCSGSFPTRRSSDLVQDTSAPTISCPVAASPIECPASPVFPTPTATACDDRHPEVTFSDVPTADACAGSYSVTRTWTATDCSGNHASCSQTVVVQDT